MAANGTTENEELKEKEENLDEIAPLKLTGQRISEITKTPRRMSIQASINKVSLQQEEFTASSLMGAPQPTQSLRMYRRFEQSYLQDLQSQADPEKTFKLGDILDNINSGMQVIVDDDFSLCFKRPERRSWNWNPYLLVFWCIGVVLRYCILFPLRLLTMILAILLTLAQRQLWQKLFANDPKKCERWELWSIQTCIQIILASWGAVIEFKGVIAARKSNQIYVANHSTMLDWLLLMYYAPFCAVGQLHTSRPMVKWFQTEFLRSMQCIWFNRSEQKDRILAMNRIKEHILDKSKPRLIIFPEGTCVNNEYCIQFKKGAFSLGCEICPVAIKYNPSFIDAYWISRERSFAAHIMDMMTSWAMVAEVHFLEPQIIKKDENAIQFAARVKKMIADAAGLKNVEWNGYLKHYKPSERVIDAQKKLMAENLEHLYQQIFIQNLQNRTSIIDQAIGNGGGYVNNAENNDGIKKRKTGYSQNNDNASK